MAPPLVAVRSVWDSVLGPSAWDQFVQWLRQTGCTLEDVDDFSLSDQVDTVKEWAEDCCQGADQVKLFMERIPDVLRTRTDPMAAAAAVPASDAAAAAAVELPPRDTGVPSTSSWSPRTGRLPPQQPSGALSLTAAAAPPLNATPAATAGGGKGFVAGPSRMMDERLAQLRRRKEEIELLLRGGERPREAQKRARDVTTEKANEAKRRGIMRAGQSEMDHRWVFRLWKRHKGWKKDPGCEVNEYNAALPRSQLPQQLQYQRPSGPLQEQLPQSLHLQPVQQQQAPPPPQQQLQQQAPPQLQQPRVQRLEAAAQVARSSRAARNAGRPQCPPFTAPLDVWRPECTKCRLPFRLQHEGIQAGQIVRPQPVAAATQPEQAGGGTPPAAAATQQAAAHPRQPNESWEQPAGAAARQPPAAATAHPPPPGTPPQKGGHLIPAATGEACAHSAHQPAGRDAPGYDTGSRPLVGHIVEKPAAAKCTLHVSNINSNESDFLVFVSLAVPSDWIRLTRFIRRGTAPGMAFLRFNQPHQCAEAKARLDLQTLRGEPIKVMMAKREMWTDEEKQQDASAGQPGTNPQQRSRPRDAQQPCAADGPLAGGRGALPPPPASLPTPTEQQQQQQQPGALAGQQHAAAAGALPQFVCCHFLRGACTSSNCPWLHRDEWFPCHMHSENDQQWCSVHKSRNAAAIVQMQLASSEV
eukprot:TRINITY_DN12248_c0_g1_i3.p1 TRINITY_DN12248_c0_g1~~TRINITY_DN12248_c0_g1_i3.p1  ORF type:complete len:697 (+),score=105.44 TRINITY_DN12248_c0_g1_i3:62-2152(+)